MLLTNQKTINYEIYIKTSGNHSFCFVGTKIIQILIYFYQNINFNTNLSIEALLQRCSLRIP